MGACFQTRVRTPRMSISSISNGCPGAVRALRTSATLFTRDLPAVRPAGTPVVPNTVRPVSWGMYGGGGRQVNAVFPARVRVVNAGRTRPGPLRDRPGPAGTGAEAGRGRVVVLREWGV
ncbi:hypothetical protein Acsp03_08310 [Actinomadura sp. NBRC 104412]|nr:hypothetical protein Acsp03_08310 [Actinomadura sp. NBRC 104412]